MSEEEVFIFIVSASIAAWFFIRWYRFVARASKPGGSGTAKTVLALTPAFLCAVIITVLSIWAAPDVVGVYVLFYATLGVAWIFLGLMLLQLFFDLSWIDDVLNNGNRAALIAVFCALTGFTLIYSGSNVGDGPGWWCVLFASLLGFGWWCVLAIFINLTTSISYRVTVERDTWAAVRLGAYFLSAGVIIGRACAGDWLSLSSTMTEFLDAWPTLPLTVFLVVGEGLLAKRKENDDAAVSVIFCIVYIAVAAVSLFLLPELSINTLR